MSKDRPLNMPKSLLNKPFYKNSLLKVSKSIVLAVALFALCFGFGAGKAEAVAPSYSAYYSSSNLVQITVNGDPNANVSLYYYQLGTNLLTGPTYVGVTNSAGYFNTSVASNAYGIVGGATTYVTVNGQQSPTVVWPNTNSIGNGSAVYLSQSSTFVSTGQSTSVTIYGGNGSYSISSNTNPNAASVSISGNTLYINGVTQGSATLNICSQNTTSCATLLVTVTGSYYGNGSVTLSQGSVFLNQGQNQVITINGSGSYYLSNNPNSNIATATVSGNTLTIYGINPGSVSFSVCSGSGTYSCAAVYVNVSTYSPGSSYPYNYNNYNNNNSYYPYNYNNYNGSSYTYPYNYIQPTTYTYPTTYTQPTTYTYPSTYSYSGTQTGTPVSGVFLNQVPNTGISFGIKILLFTLGLIFWSIFGAFLISKKYPTQFAFLSMGTNASDTSVSGKTTSQNIAEAFKQRQMLKKRGLVK